MPKCIQCNKEFEFQKDDERKFENVCPACTAKEKERMRPRVPAPPGPTVPENPDES